MSDMQREMMVGVNRGAGRPWHVATIDPEEEKARRLELRGRVMGIAAEAFLIFGMGVVVGSALFVVAMTI